MLRLRSIVAEADELGISFFVIAGGEPLTRPEIVDIARDHPRVIFLLITNGLLDEGLIAKLTRLRNVVPVLSVEGTQAETDERRGRGVHEHLRGKMQRLQRAGIFFSLSFTVTRSNFDTVTDEWVITNGQRESMKELVASSRARFPAVFIAVPWDEEEQGGCLASGRGFVHISANGDLEPCPFAPYSDTDVLHVPLKEALRSRSLRVMRENHELFAETEGGCALWKNREAVRALLDQKAV